MNLHLEQAHGITKDNPRDSGPKSTLSRQASLANVQSQLSSNSWNRASTTPSRIEFNSDIFKALLIRWICSSNISFAIVEHHAFRQLLTYLLASVCFLNYLSIYISLYNLLCRLITNKENKTQVSLISGLNLTLPRSSTTITNWILDTFKIAKARLITLLSNVTYKIHFSFDLWSSPNHRSFLALVAHWVSPEGHLIAATLGFQRLEGPHSGANQADLIWKILEVYQLTHKLGYFTMNNASNNDTALGEIQRLSQLKGVKFDPSERRVRCFGHIINLVVKAFLWGDQFERFEREVHTFEEIQQESELLHAWRKKGPLGKLHNIATWILRSPQRRERFAKVVQQQLPDSSVLVPLVGNATRWHSDVDALERAFVLRIPLDGFVALAAKEERQRLGGRRKGKGNETENDNEQDPEYVSTDELTLDDWEDLKVISNILMPFKRISLYLQGMSTNRNRANGYLSQVLPAMDELLSHLEDAKTRYSDSSIYSTHILTSINHAWDILDKYILRSILAGMIYFTYKLILITRYYQLADVSKVLYAAVALDPEMRLQYFESEWKERPEWIVQAKEKAKGL